MQVLTWLVPYLVGGTVGGILGLVFRELYTSARSRLAEWSDWLADHTRLWYLGAVEDLGYRLETSEMQEIADGEAGRRPPWFIRRAYWRLTKRRRSKSLQNFQDYGGPATIVP